MTKKKLQTNFKRIETKYILDKATLASLKEDLKDYLVDDDYAQSSITNIYFDTDDYQVIQDSLARVNGREKIRMRTYEAQPTDHSQVFLEIKKKEDEVGYKYRLVSNPLSVLNFIEKGIKDESIDDERVVEELARLQDRYLDLKPKMYIAYQRHSLKAKKEHKVRLTVDSQLLYRDYDLDISAGRYGYPLLEEDKVILEVKVAGAYPTWLTQALQKYKLLDQSFSKYGKAYLKSQERLTKLVKS
ncbi:polyphosphate polymerase domain-containing protein [Streptococcus oricebi]|uniref:Transporter n=1 Tax=Streptococcus oricebi TaxID=1547447 RepID=A0ABS5B2R7_9STRE|nr:polyphosphate polymerase domain-containing protein [Streptococcus oricebi]MBP2623060.1 transporter [Streptococcus oricebi]